MKSLYQKISRLLKAHRINKQLRHILMGFACIVVFITTYTLILPAITLEKGALICGMEVHEHTQDCYADVLTCPLAESEGHVHGDECWHSDWVLICEETEHIHSEECRNEEGEIICGLEEHQHDDTCYEEIRTLTCPLEESEGHIHSADCYERQLVCGKEQHVHNSSCYAETEPAPETEPPVVEEPYENDPSDDSSGNVVDETDQDNADQEIFNPDENEDLNGESEDESISENPDEESKDESDSGNPEEESDDESDSDNQNEESEENDSDNQDGESKEESDSGNPEEESEKENDSDNQDRESEDDNDSENSDGESEEEINTEDGSDETEETENQVEYNLRTDLGEVLTETTGLWILNAENQWAKIDENTRITSSDNILVRFSYNIPALSMDDTHAELIYPIPTSILLDQEKVNFINDDGNYLNQMISGFRMPEDLNTNYSDGEYLTGKYRIEPIDADSSTSAAGAGQDWQLVCSFNEYSVYENATAPLNGWMMFYLTGADLATDANGWGSILFTEAGADGQRQESIYHITYNKDGATPEENTPEESTPEEGTPEETMPEESSPETETDVTEETSGEEETTETGLEETSGEDETTEISLEETSAEEETAETEVAEETGAEDETIDTLALTHPAQTFEGSTPTMNVTVYAGTGAFPAGTTMVVSDVDDEEIVTAIVDTVNETSEKNTSSKHVLATDITFYDKDGQKIEPLIPIHVAMNPINIPENITLDTDSVIVHVDDNGNTEIVEQRDVNEVIGEIREEEIQRETVSDNTEDTNQENEKAVDNTDNEQESAADESSTEDETSEGNEVTQEITEEASVDDILPLPEEAVVFDADKFSVYAVAYTVDFHWEVDGKMYEFSIPGGGFVSLEHVVEVLGIARIGGNIADSGENEINEGENALESTYNEVEETAVEAIDENTGGNYEESINLNNVEVSEATKKFVADVVSMEFSSPELVWVGKADEATTVGGLKEANGLDVQYSYELTEEQIIEINGAVVDSGDWALISVQPFTSEESLTVTMNNGDQFVVKVTDAQLKKTVIDAKGDTWEITVIYGEDAQIPEGAELDVREILEDTEEYKEYLENSAKELGVVDKGIRFARFFDIQIIDKNGEKIEPGKPVQVKIAYKEVMPIQGTSALSIVHFADSGNEVIKEISLTADNTTLTYLQDSFSVTGTIITEPSQGGENKYMVLVNYPNGSDHYYIVNNDGSLTKVSYDSTNGTVEVEYPMLWTIDGSNPNRHIYFNTEATGFNYQDTAADYYRRYLDPSAENGITEENSDNITLGRYYGDNVKTGYVVTNRNTILSQTSVNNYVDNGVEKVYHGQWNDGMCLGVELDAEGNPIRISGMNSWSDAVHVVFAEARSVPGVATTHHTVDHIDISISGKSEITVPLAYGKYYYQDSYGQWQEYDVTTSTSLHLEKDDVSITAEDMKKATIKAYNPRGEEVSDAFVIDGYSSNASNAYSTIQVRIGGRFKVADTYEGGGNDAATKTRRLANKITYSVSAIKELTFDLKDDTHGQLYEKLADGTYRKMSVTVDVNMSASFDYWDERNECPGIKNEIIWGSHDTWLNGGIPEHGLSGMDFVLGGDAEDADSKIVAVEITKLIVDNNGHRIRPSATTSIVNSFNIYQDIDGNCNSVVGLDVNQYSAPANYEGYSKLHSKDIKVGHDGMGLVYDYDVTPGMYYIQEDKDTIPDIITDLDGETWHYSGTRIETEYAWRDQPEYDNGIHVSDIYTKNGSSDYNSIPEILGNYTDINGKAIWHNPDTGKNEPVRNGFLEFFVYNIYEPEKTDLTVRKDWENGSAPEDASVDVVIKRYKLVPDGSITPPEPTTASLTITDSYSGLSGSETYSATYIVTGPDDFTQSCTWNGNNITIDGLPFGEYTVSKTAISHDGYDAENLVESQTISLEVAGAEVTFAGTTYTRQSTADTYYRVLVYSDDTMNQGTEHIASNGHYAWVDEEYLKGTQLDFTVGVPAWNNNSTYSYSINGATAVSIEAGKTKTERLSIDRDLTIVIHGATPYYSQWLNPTPNVTIVSSPKSSQMYLARGTWKAPAAVLKLSNKGLNPAVEGYTWQEDSTWLGGDGLTIHLPDSSNWYKKVEDLEKKDAYGNVYVYYIDSVTENGMPSRMTAQILLDGENKQFVYGDHSKEAGSVHTDDTLQVKNILATGTNMTIKKLIKGTTTALPGAQFKVQEYTDNTYRIKKGDPVLLNDKDNNGIFTISELQIGYYKLEESVSPQGYIKTSEDPVFEVRQNPTTKEVEVVFTNTSMVTYANGTFEVQNEPGAALPNTGGSGTNLLYLFGIMLTGFAGTGLVMKRWKRRVA